MRISLSRLFKSAVLAGSLIGVTFAANAQEFKLRWGHYLPNSPFVQVEKDFAKKIEERTNGRVKIDITFAGGLGKGNEVALLAGRGAIDMASVESVFGKYGMLYGHKYSLSSN